jgi:hypothetical protein
MVRLLFSFEPFMHNHTQSCTYLHRIPALFAQPLNRARFGVAASACLRLLCVAQVMETSASHHSMLTMLLARSRSHRKQASSMLHWQTEELKTLTINMPCNVGALVAHSPTGLATASAERHSRSSALGRRSRLSSEAGTCGASFTEDQAMPKTFRLVQNSFLHRTAAMCSFDQ